MTRILQINVGVRRAAQDLALGSAARWGADVLVVSEQNRAHPSEADGWYSDESDLAAIAVVGNVSINQVGPVVRGFRWVEFPGFRLYSCYWTPNCALAEYVDFLRRLEISIRTSSAPVIVAGDFNAKSSAWGSPRDDIRGSHLVDIISALDASVCNEGQSPTFVRGESATYIDVTFASARIRGTVNNWSVRDDESLSLHKYIMFDVNVSIAYTPRSCSGWAFQKTGKNKLVAALASTFIPAPTSTSAETEAEELVGWITRALDSCFPKRHHGEGRRPVPWWNQRIDSLRKDCLKARRIFQRARSKFGEDGSREQEERWKENRKLLSTEIKIAKEKCWADLIKTVDNDPWGKPYRIVMKRLRSNKPIPGLQLPGRLMGIINALFPTVPRQPLPARPTTAEELEAPFSIAELTSAASSLPNGKAPGPDGIRNEVIKAAISFDPARFQRAFNVCLTSGTFPERWKKGKLVLAQKPGKPLNTPSAYRPICLLDGCGKLLEKLLVKRLRDHLTKNQAIAQNQYGFRSGRSTLHALEHLKTIVKAATTGHPNYHRYVGMLTLDVRNAFNSAPWDRILKAARLKNVPAGLIRMLEAYLSNRTIVLPGLDDEGNRLRVTNCGVPQGSVLGPDLWILLYDDLLRITLPDDVEIIAFADDVAVLCTTKDIPTLETKLEVAYDSINSWMLENGLSLAAEKTEAMVITKRRVRNQMTVVCDGHAIESKPNVRYLGVQVDQKLGFVEHANMVSASAAKAARSLGHIMPNLRGPRQKTRKLLATVTTSKLLYAAPVWSQTMQEKGWKRLAAAHRQSQLRTACCYSTVSHEAAAVVSGIPPIRLLAKERTDIFNGKDKIEARKELITNWQREWADGAKGRWTFRLIRDLDKWMSRAFGEVCFHTTQLFTGHGCFAAYLYRFKIQESEACEQCGRSPDDAEHAFFFCDAWENWRRQACAEMNVAELTPDNIVETMLSSPFRWGHTSKLITRVMMAREKEERTRQEDVNM